MPETKKLSPLVEITLNDLQLKYIKTLIHQSNTEELYDMPILYDSNSIDKVEQLLQARKIYVELYGYQYHEEKNLLEELQPLFTYLKLIINK